MNGPPAPGGIALLVYDLRGSGVVRNALRIAAAASDAGLRISLWPIRCQGELLGAVPANLPIRPIRNRSSHLQRDLDSLAAVPALARAIDRDRPDVLVSGGNHTHLHAALALRRARAGPAIRFVGRASNAVVSAGASGKLGRAAIYGFERFQYRAMDRIVAVSDELAKALAETFGIDPGRIATVPNGVDVRQVQSAASLPFAHPFFAPGAPPVVLGIGRYSHQKNFEGLLHAFALAREQRPMRLMILGSGGAWRENRLRRLARRLQIDGDFALEGFVPNPFLYLARAGLFVLNSRWEGASNVLLEALACGCPIVAARAPTGIVEVMRDGEVGPLVTVGDDRALAAAMIERLEQPRAAEALRLRAADYDLDRTLAAYVDMLSDELRRAVA